MASCIRRIPSGPKTGTKGSVNVTVLDPVGDGWSPKSGSASSTSPRTARTGAPVAAHREQTVEIALGPKGAFDNGNIGILTRRVAADRVVSAIPPRRGQPKSPKDPKTPRVVELLRKAIE